MIALKYFHRWSRAEAIEFMTNHTASAPGSAANEIDRYITWPGQACAYKVGEIKIKELRRNAENELGIVICVNKSNKEIILLQMYNVCRSIWKLRMRVIRSLSHVCQIELTLNVSSFLKKYIFEAILYESLDLCNRS